MVVRGFFILFFLLSIPLTSSASDKIFVFREPDGVIRFTTRPPAGVKAKVFKARSSGFSWYRGNSTGVRRSSNLYRTRYSQIIRTASERYAVDEPLLRAVIHAESSFNPRAVSPKGALGLMQIMPFNLRPLGVSDPFSPEQNILGGARLLSKLTRQYGGDLKRALAAYNAGEGAVARYNGVPPYRETVNYVKKVLSLAQRYQG